MPNSSSFIKFLLLVCFLPLMGLAQNWSALPGVRPNRYLSSLCVDTLRDKLYAGGDFKYINQQEIHGIFQWDGYTHTAMGCGVGNCGGLYCGGVRSMLMHQGNLLTLFPSDSMDCSLAYSIAQWDGLQWHTFNQQFFNFGSNLFPTAIFSFDSIFVVNGFIDSIQGMKAHGQVQYDGSTWSNFLYCPLMSDDVLGMPSMIRYKGVYYSFSLETDTLGQHQNFSRWNGSCWEKVPNVFNSVNMSIYKMLIYQGDLYVAGSFSTYWDPSAPGNDIAKFDGQNWSSLNGGVRNFFPHTVSEIRDMVVHNGYLYVVGVFQLAGGIPARNIARWDGNSWCSFGSDFDNVISSIAFYHDSLYIGGGFHTIDGDTLEFFAKWVGGNYLDSCTAPDGIDDFEAENSIHIFPNPATDIVYIESNQLKVKSCSIYSIAGELLTEIAVANFKNRGVNVAGLPGGIYVIMIQTNQDRTLFRKLVKD